MITLYDYLPSQNGWKVRQLLRDLGLPYTTRLVSIFEGEGQTESYRAINPWGAVPALELADGRVLSESNAILFFLARGSEFLPQEAFPQAKVLQWLSFEADYVQSTIGSLRYWTLTRKLAARPADTVETKRQQALRALSILNQHLADKTYVASETYTIADISLFAYGAHAGEAGLPIDDYPHFRRWIDRVAGRPDFLAERYPYDIDPASFQELP